MIRELTISELRAAGYAAVITEMASAALPPDTLPGTPLVAVIRSCPRRQEAFIEAVYQRGDDLIASAAREWAVEIPNLVREVVAEVRAT